MEKMIKNIKTKKKFIPAVCLSFILCALSGCGSENQKPEPTPTYIYVPKQMVVSPAGEYSLPDGFGKPAVESGQMYFMRQRKDSQTVERVVLLEDGSAVDFNDAEMLFSLSSFAFEQEKDVSENEVLAILDRAIEAESMSNSQSREGDEAVAVDPEETYFRFLLWNFAVDQEQNVYFIIDCRLGSYYTAESVGSVLCKRNAAGEWAYRRFFPGLEPVNDSFTVDGSGGVYILTADGILAVDSDGHEAGVIDTEKYKGRSYSSERLLGDSRGNVCYIVFEEFDSRWKGLEVDRPGRDLKELNGLSGNNWLDTCTVFQGDIFFSVSESLYMYNRETESSGETLRWVNSGLVSSHIRDCFLLNQDKILVWYDEPGMEGLYLLEKTPARELPEKEAVVLAAFDVSAELSNAVIHFNRLNKKYQVIIESYGYSGGTASGALARQDAALASSNPPDLLSLSGRNLVKDMEKGMLEDLSPRLENSSILDRDDFLENALDGYTIGKSLVGIPVSFRVTAVGGRTSQVGELNSWTMEDVYALTERYPEHTILLSDARYVMDSGMGRNLATREHLLKNFCAACYLEEYVDWETGTCDFDSERFRRLLEWTGEHAEDPVGQAGSRGRIFYIQGYLSEEALLMEKNIDFGTAAEWELQCGEEITLTGFPTADGSGTADIQVEPPLGIVADAGNKEGAWEFLEFYISAGKEQGLADNLPTSRSRLQALMEEAVGQQYYDGSEEPVPKYYLTLDDEEVPVYATSREMAEKLMAFLEAADFTPDWGLRQMVVSIVLEESEPYYTGDKSLEEVTGIIQNRVQLLLKENM